MNDDIIKQFRPIRRGEFFTVGVDTAAGGIDYCVGQFMSQSGIDVPLVYAENVTATEMTPKMAAILNKVYDLTGVRPVVAFERNNGGVFELERLARLNKQDKYLIYETPQFGDIVEREPVKIGWDTNGATRPKMMSDLKEAIDRHLIKVYDESTIEEMFSFIIFQMKTQWKAAADVGKHDDRLMALAITYQLFQTERPSDNYTSADFPHEDVFDEEGFY